MTMTRRDAMTMAAGAAAALTLPLPALAALEPTFEEALDAFTGGAPIADGGVTLDAPEIAENGNTVPVGVSAEGASAILLLAAGNPNPGVATFHFGPLAGSSAATTRIRLATTQDLVAIAKLADGSFARASTTVKVTIGGCGG